MRTGKKVTNGIFALLLVVSTILTGCGGRSSDEPIDLPPFVGTWLYQGSKGVTFRADGTVTIHTMAHRSNQTKQDNNVVKPVLDIYGEWSVDQEDILFIIYKDPESRKLVYQKCAYAATTSYLYLNIFEEWVYFEKSLPED